MISLSLMCHFTRRVLRSLACFIFRQVNDMIAVLTAYGMWARSNRELRGTGFPSGLVLQPHLDTGFVDVSS